MTDELQAPSTGLRAAAYQDLCAFFGTFPDGQDWTPHLADWIVVPPSQDPLLVLAFDPDTGRVTAIGADGAAHLERPRSACVWLPTLDQLRVMLREQFGTTGFFSSSFNGSTYWYTGQMLGMTVTNMQPLAEGSSPEEAALKALLMRHQR